MSYRFEPPAIVAADFSSQNSDKIHCSSALARHLGLISGVIMSDIWYWTSRNLAKWDGWFYRSQDEWQEKTGLSDDSVTRRLNSLEKAGHIESKRGKHPEATSPKQWVKFYRATQSFNDLYSKVLATEGVEDKTAECGNDGEENRRMRGSSGDKTAECGDLQGTKPQNAVMISPKPLPSQDYSPPQGSIDQGNIDQGLPPNPQQAGGTIAAQDSKIETCLSSPEGIESKTVHPDPEPKLRRRAAAPKKPGRGDRFSQDGLTDKQRQCRVIALRKECFSSDEEVASLVDPELAERIQRTWSWYKGKCSDLPNAAGIGDKASAAIALVILWETNFLGYGVDGFRKGCTLFAERMAEKKGSGVPACSRFLVGKSGEQPYWVQELVRTETVGSVSDPAGEAVHRPAVDQEEVSRRLVEQARREIDQQFSNEQGAA